MCPPTGLDRLPAYSVPLVHAFFPTLSFDSVLSAPSILRIYTSAKSSIFGTMPNIALILLVKSDQGQA